MRTGIWIPAWIEKLDLSSNQKRLFAEIVSLHEKGKCFASNTYFSEILGVKQDTVSGMISVLKKKGLIKQTGFDGRKRFLEPILTFGFDKNPKQSRVGEERKTSSSLLQKSVPASDIPKTPLYSTKEVHNRVQKSWKEFLEWSKGKVSKSTWESINLSLEPNHLTGSSKLIWEKWQAI